MQAHHILSRSEVEDESQRQILQQGGSEMSLVVCI